MEALTCNMCGGRIILSADQTTGVCECCGNTAVVSRFNRKQRIAAMNRGNEFRACGDFDTALSIYEHIISEDDTDAEAHWCAALCRFGIEYVQDPTTLEYLPTCHRLSLDSFLDDVDYLAAMAHSAGMLRWQYQREGAKIAAVQRGTLATSRAERPFDVFLCCKDKDEHGSRSEDSVLAQDLHSYLSGHGFRVFFSHITLEDKAGEEFEPYIFSALNSARVMVVIGTKPEHLASPWVKNEWSRFLNLKKKHPNKLLIPCYKGMDPQSMPAPLNSLQSYDITEIAFMQDLLRGVQKVFPEKNSPAPAAPAPAAPIQVMAGDGVSTDNLLTRVRFFLEDRDWESADRYCERALDTAPRCAEAYFYKLIAGWFLNAPGLPVLARRLETFSPSLTELETQAITEENRMFFWNLFLRADCANRLHALLDLFPKMATHQISTPEWEDTSLLNESIRSGGSLAVELLLKHHADPNAAYRKWTLGEETFTCSPLSEAVQAVNGPELVRILLDWGADPALTDTVAGLNGVPGPQNVFQQAVTFRRPEVLDALLNWQEIRYAGDDLTPPPLPRAFLLRQAVMLGYEDMVQVLLAHGADSDQAGREEGKAVYTLLSDTMGLPNGLALAALLLDHGADPNGCDSVPSKNGTESSPALHRAILTQNMDFITLLLDHGASWDTPYSDGKMEVPLRLYPYYMNSALPADFLTRLGELGWKRSVRSVFTLSSLMRRKVHHLVDIINE